LARPVPLVVVRVVSFLRRLVAMLLPPVMLLLLLLSPLVVVMRRLVAMLLVVRVVSRLRRRAGLGSLIHLPPRTAAHHRGSTRQRSDRSLVRLREGPRVDLSRIPLVVS